MKLFAIGTSDTKTSVALLLLRVVAGISIVVNHGLMKLQNYSAMSDKFPDPIGVGSQLSLTLALGAEFFCGILLILGFATRLIAIPLIITMLTAFLIIHSADPFSMKELPLLFMTMFTVVLIMGPGKYSVDSLIKSK
jgi:putative oxidoreductase